MRGTRRDGGAGPGAAAMAMPTVRKTPIAGSRATGVGRRAWGIGIQVFAFACFFPYPALSIGQNNGLQASQLMAIAAVPLLLLGPPNRQFRATLLLMAPIYVSTFANYLRGTTSSADIMVKESIAMSLALVVLWPSGLAAGRATFGRTLDAAAAAIVVHTAVGLVQVYSFASDTFPMLVLYQNPSFRSMQDWAAVYATYMKRPCGIFPEPSAMAASLGPWIVVLGGLLVEPERARRLGWRPNALTVAAVVGGLLLLALSRSGMVFVIAVALLAVGATRLRLLMRSFGLAQFAAIALLIVGGTGVLGYAVSKIGGEGLAERVEDSWGLRGASIRMGLLMNTEPAGLAFGVGPGQSSPIIQATWSGPPVPAYQGEVSIWSALVRYYAETGWAGGAALTVVLAIAIRSAVGSSAPVLGLGALGVWLFGPTLATSYMPLSAIWLFLGVALSWGHLFRTEGRDVQD